MMRAAPFITWLSKYDGQECLGGNERVLSRGGGMG